MKKFVSILFSPLVLSVIGLLLFAAIVWFVGPLVSVASVIPLASSHVRVALIVAVFLIWGLRNVRQNAVNQRAAERFTHDSASDDLTNASFEQCTNANALNESRMIQERLKQALRVLRARGHRFFSRQSQQIPWYIVIGAPQSGKTTLVQQTGFDALTDPTTQQFMFFSDSELPSTCEWWINDDAMLIDTVGRFTVQDPHAPISAQSWLTLLSSLKKARPKCPLSGVIVTISADDLLTRTSAHIAHQAQAIRRRLQELNSHLGMTLPVYVVITKCDVLAGFRAFYRELASDKGEQSLGFTLPENSATSEYFQQCMVYLERAFDQYIQSINDQVLPRMHAESLGRRRDRILQFPHQFSALRETILDMMVQIFSPTHLEESAFWRGLYFTSALHVNQESRLAVNLLPVEGISNPAEVLDAECKPLFIRDLLPKRVITESHLAHFNLAARQKFRWLYVSAIAVSSMCFAFLLYVWIVNYQNQQTVMASIQTQITDYEKITQGGLNAKSDWITLASGLTKLRNLPSGYQDEIEEKNGHSFDFYHRHRIEAQATQAYLQALHRFFFRKLNEMLLKALDGRKRADDYLYEALRCYLMLYQTDKMDLETFRAWVHHLWQKELPIESQGAVIIALDQHLMVLFDKKIPAPPMDQQRVSEARAILHTMPIANRIYRRILETQPQQSRTLSVVSVLGAHAKMLFSRKSGKPLSEGIPLLFTYRGFHSDYLLKKISFSEALSADQWIYGAAERPSDVESVHDTSSDQGVASPTDVDQNVASSVLHGVDAETIGQEIDALYFADYVRYWDDYLSDLELQPVTNADTLYEVLSGLNAVNRPLTRWLDTVRQHVALNQLPPAAHTNTASVTELATAVDSQRLQRAARLSTLVPKDLASSLPLPGQAVADHFSDWIDYLTPEPEQPFASVDGLITELQAYWSSLSLSSDFSEAAYHSVSTGQDKVLTDFQQALKAAPSPLQNMLLVLAKSGVSFIRTGVRQFINARWKIEVLSPYQEKLVGRYPFDRQAKSEVSLTEFAQFFAPGYGTVDSFMQSVLTPFVAKNGKHLRWLNEVGLSEQTLTFYTRVAAIQEAYFSTEDGKLRFEFLLSPQMLDSAATAFYLNVGEDQYAYFHGPVKSTRLHWPSENSEESKITFALASRGTPVSLSKRGPWSWFRLLDDYGVLRMDGNSQEITLSFEKNGLKTTHILRPLSGVNPFDVGLLGEFHLPEKL